MGVVIAGTLISPPRAYMLVPQATRTADARSAQAICNAAGAGWARQIGGARPARPGARPSGGTMAKIRSQS